MTNPKDLEWQDGFLTRIHRCGHANDAVIDRLVIVLGERSLERKRAKDTIGQGRHSERARRLNPLALEGRCG